MSKLSFSYFTVILFSLFISGCGSEPSSPSEAHPDTVEIFEDSSTLVDVLINDVNLSLLIHLTSPIHGTASIVDNKLSYIPNENYFGIDSFIYKATDTSGNNQNQSTITITILPVNDAPTATPFSLVESPIDTAISIQTLGNFSDIENDPLNFSIDISNPLPATLSIHPITGVISGTPLSAETINSNIIASDGLLSVSNPISIVILPAAVINEPPFITSPIPDVEMMIDSVETINLNEFFSDPEGEVLSFSSTLANGLDSPSWVSINPSNELTLSPIATNNISLNITATDSSQNSVQTTLQVVVLEATGLLSPGITNTFDSSTASPTPNQYVSFVAGTTAGSLSDSFKQIWIDADKITAEMDGTVFALTDSGIGKLNILNLNDSAQMFNTRTLTPGFYSNIKIILSSSKIWMVDNDDTITEKNLTDNKLIMSENFSVEPGKTTSFIIDLSVDSWKDVLMSSDSIDPKSFSLKKKPITESRELIRKISIKGMFDYSYNQLVINVMNSDRKINVSNASDFSFTSDKNYLIQGTVSSSYEDYSINVVDINEIVDDSEFIKKRVKTHGIIISSTKENEDLYMLIRPSKTSAVNPAKLQNIKVTPLTKIKPSISALLDGSRVIVNSEIDETGAAVAKYIFVRNAPKFDSRAYYNKTLLLTMSGDTIIFPNNGISYDTSNIRRNNANTKNCLESGNQVPMRVIGSYNKSENVVSEVQVKVIRSKERCKSGSQIIVSQVESAMCTYSADKELNHSFLLKGTNHMFASGSATDKPLTFSYDIITAKDASIETFGQDYSLAPEENIIKLTLTADMAGVSNADITSIAGAEVDFELDWSNYEPFLFSESMSRPFLSLKTIDTPSVWQTYTNSSTGALKKLVVGSIDTSANPRLTLIDNHFSSDFNYKDRPTKLVLGHIYLNPVSDLTLTSIDFNALVVANEASTSFNQSNTKINILNNNTSQIIQVRNAELITKSQASINEYNTDLTSGNIDKVMKFELWLDATKLKSFSKNETEIRGYQFDMNWSDSDVTPFNFQTIAGSNIGFNPNNPANSNIIFNSENGMVAMASAIAIVDSDDSSIMGVPKEKLIGTFYLIPNSNSDPIRLFIDDMLIVTSSNNISPNNYFTEINKPLVILQAGTNADSIRLTATNDFVIITQDELRVSSSLKSFFNINSSVSYATIKNDKLVIIDFSDPTAPLEKNVVDITPFMGYARLTSTIGDFSGSSIYVKNEFISRTSPTFCEITPSPTNEGVAPLIQTSPLTVWSGNTLSFSSNPSMVAYLESGNTAVSKLSLFSKVLPTNFDQYIEVLGGTESIRAAFSEEIANLKLTFNSDNVNFDNDIATWKAKIIDRIGAIKNTFKEIDAAVVDNYIINNFKALLANFEEYGHVDGNAVGDFKAKMFIFLRSVVITNYSDDIKGRDQAFFFQGLLDDTITNDNIDYYLSSYLVVVTQRLKLNDNFESNISFDANQPYTMQLNDDLVIPDNFNVYFSIKSDSGAGFSRRFCNPETPCNNFYYKIPAKLYRALPVNADGVKSDIVSIKAYGYSETKQEPDKTTVPIEYHKVITFTGPLFENADAHILALLRSVGGQFNKALLTYEPFKKYLYLNLGNDGVSLSAFSKELVLIIQQNERSSRSRIASLVAKLSTKLFIGNNNPPVILSIIPNLTAFIGSTFEYDFSQHFKDPDGDTITYELKLDALNPDPDWQLPTLYYFDTNTGIIRFSDHTIPENISFFINAKDDSHPIPTASNSFDLSVVPMTSQSLDEMPSPLGTSRVAPQSSNSHKLIVSTISLDSTFNNININWSSPSPQISFLDATTIAIAHPAATEETNIVTLVATPLSPSISPRTFSTELLPKQGIVTKQLVIRVNFPLSPEWLSTEQDESGRMFSDPLSVAGYLFENSSGRSILSPALLPPTTSAPSSIVDTDINDGVLVYNFSTNPTPKKVPQGAVIRTILSDLDLYIDFSIFDTNKDGVVQSSELNILFNFNTCNRASGQSVCYPKNNDYSEFGYWPASTSSSSYSISSDDGVKIGGSSDSRITWVTDYDHFVRNNPSYHQSFEIIVHEFGHNLYGILDLYTAVSNFIAPKSKSNTSIYKIGVMGNPYGGGFINNTYRKIPPHMTTYGKNILGFIDPIISTNYSRNIAQSPSSLYGFNNQRYNSFVMTSESTISNIFSSQYIIPEVRNNQFGYDRALQSYFGTSPRSGVVFSHISPINRNNISARNYSSLLQNIITNDELPDTSHTSANNILFNPIHKITNKTKFHDRGISKYSIEGEHKIDIMMGVPSIEKVSDSNYNITLTN